MNNSPGYDDTIPQEYLNNENPYAYCTDYHANSINMPDKKLKLSALQRIQPTKVSFRMPLRHVENEKDYLINYAIEAERNYLLKTALKILKIDYHDNPEFLIENNLHIPEILEIGIQIKKLKLFFHQKRLRSKVSSALASKISDDLEYSILSRGIVEVDNLKDALIYCKLKDLYENSSN